MDGSLAAGTACSVMKYNILSGSLTSAEHYCGSSDLPGVVTFRHIG
jgi:hypothetical protein